MKLKRTAVCFKKGNPCPLHKEGHYVASKCNTIENVKQALKDKYRKQKSENPFFIKERYAKNKIVYLERAKQYDLRRKLKVNKRCECGKLINPNRMSCVRCFRTKNNKELFTGKSRSLEARKKASISMRGSNNPAWKGGITGKNKTLRRSLEYRLWRESVFKRDNFTCIWCGKHGVELNADHIKQFAYFPELRFAIDNGRTLCIPCHKTTDTFKAHKKI